MSFLAETPIGFLPVLAFLTALIYLDSYKLVKLRSIVTTIIVGGISAAVAMFVNVWLLNSFTVDTTIFARYLAPPIEEILKAAYIVILMKRQRIGFPVDGAIYGFAIGTGFALIENIYYMSALENSSVVLWIVRGFGTAVMHGGTTAVFAIIARTMADRSTSASTALVAGLLTATVAHSLFNHFVLPPVIMTLLLVIFFPLFIIAVFNRSEKATRNWLGMGMDADTELLEVITSGGISQTRVGRYLESLKTSFSGEVVADMLCFLRIYLELAVRAKGILLMREAGFEISSDPEIRAKLEELKFLERSIGKTGKLTILPFMNISSRDLWQLYLVER